MRTSGGFSIIAVFLSLFAFSHGGHAQLREIENEGAKRIFSLDLEKEEIAEALRILSEEAGLNLIVSNKVTGQVNVFLKQIEPEEALKQTITVNGYHYIQEGDVIWVLSKQEFFRDFNQGLERRIFRLSHAKAINVSQALLGILSDEGSVQPYPETNVLLVTEKRDRIEEIEKMVQELDAAPISKVFSLESALAYDLLPILAPHVADSSVLQADLRTNQIMVTETEENLERLERMIRAFDKPDRVETRRYPLKYANSGEVANIVREILTGRRSVPGQGGGSFGQPSSQRQVANLPTASQPRQGGSANPVETFREYRQAPRQTATQPLESAPPSPDAQAPGAREFPLPGVIDSEEESALGPLATVATDPRTNTVIITHTLGILNRLEKVVNDLDIPSEYHVYQFQNVNPVDIAIETKLLGILPGEPPYINVDPISGKVAFRASGEQASQVYELLQQWDEPIPQVQIRGDILLVSSSLLENLGITWQVLTSDVDVNVDFRSFADNASPLGSFGVGNLANDDWSGTIQALLTDSRSQTLASPKILVRDGQEGLFTTARDEPYTVVVTDANTRTTLEDVRFLNVGVTLAVVPKINQVGLVTLVTQLEISSLVEIRNGIPVVDRSTAQSTITVLSGGGVILGGLRQRERGNTQNSVPFAHRLPLIGGLFKNTRDETEEREIVLILRPVIVGEHDFHLPQLPHIRWEVEDSMFENWIEEPVLNPERLH